MHLLTLVSLDTNMAVHGKAQIERVLQLVLREVVSIEELLFFFDLDCVKLGKPALSRFILFRFFSVPFVL